MDEEYNALMSIGAHPARSVFWLGRRLGSHSAKLDGSRRILVEWYNFGDDVAYEYVSQMAFERADQPRLAEALGIPVESGPEVVLAALAERFSYFFDIQSFANARRIPYAKSTDFNP